MISDPPSMRCTFSPAALSASLSLALRAVSPRSTLPVLGNVLLETSEGGLRVTATNLDLTISTVVPAEVGADWRVTVPARLLADYVASLDEVPCEMELEPSTQVLRLRCGAHRASMHGIDAVEFPPLPAREEGVEIEVDAREFQGAVQQTAMAASSDEASPVLTGVLFDLDAERITMVATDRHRLAVRHLEVSPSGEWPVARIIVPARHLQEVARAVTPARPVVRISLSQARNQVFFSLRDVEVSSRLIDGTYPNYAQVIPAESATVVKLPTAVLLRGARTASVLAKDAANPVRLRSTADTLTLQAQTAEVGDDEAPLPAEVTGDEVQVAFNARYILDALSVLDSDEVQLTFNGPLSPGVIRPVGRDDYLCIIMPVRLPG